jgi:hypothetical protein
VVAPGVGDRIVDIAVYRDSVDPADSLNLRGAYREEPPDDRNQLLNKNLFDAFLWRDVSFFIGVGK